MEGLNEKIAQLCGELRITNEKMHQLSTIHDNVNDINQSLASLLGAMAARRSCFERRSPAPEEKHVKFQEQEEEIIPEKPVEQDQVPVEEKVPGPVVVEPPPPVQIKWRWKKGPEMYNIRLNTSTYGLVGVKSRIPKVYRTAEGMKRMESILFFISDADAGR